MEPNRQSPLLVQVHTELKSIGFGDVVVVPEIARLQRELNLILTGTLKRLPEPLAAESRSLLNTYSGRRGDFFSLFYVPIWSFLHWTLVNNGSVQPSLAQAAQTPHAMALFLHLWDDHLCDGQLDVDITRLQLRTVAWQSHTATCYELCEAVGLHTDLVDEHINQYLCSQQSGEPVDDLNEYCRLFSRQVGIWTAVPRILDFAIRGSEESDVIRRLVEHFAICWRLIDDIQDVDLDLMTGKQNAVWIQLDSEGRRRWDECRARSLANGKLDPGTWKDLYSAIRASGCLSELLSRTNAMLTTCVQMAGANEWHGWARELEQSRQGISRAISALD